MLPIEATNSAWRRLIPTTGPAIDSRPFPLSGAMHDCCCCMGIRSDCAVSVTQKPAVINFGIITTDGYSGIWTGSLPIAQPRKGNRARHQNSLTSRSPSISRLSRPRSPKATASVSLVPEFPRKLNHLNPISVAESPIRSRQEVSGVVHHDLIVETAVV